MKTLYFVRHAKSSWKDSSLSDRDRPLNSRGKRDAPNMAQFLSNKVECPDTFICSPSRRTLDTASHFLKAFGVSESDLDTKEKLYHGGESAFESIIQSLNDNLTSAMLFAHNPGITDYVNELTQSDIWNIPTCGMAGIKIDTHNWKNIGKANAELLFYYYPKGLDLHTQ